MSLTIVAQLQAHPGQEQALESLLGSLIAPTRAETGCEAYELHRSLETPGLFHFHEVWTSKDLWEAHMGSPHLEAFSARSDGLVAEWTLFKLERVA